jgi:ketosteroid isomerase-like protein
MSRESVELVKRALENFIATGHFSDLMAVDFVWDMTAFRGWPDQPVFHGFDGFSEFSSAWTESYDEWSMEIEQLLDAGPGQVVGCLRQQGRLRKSDAVVGLRYGVVYTVADAQVRRGKVYMTVDEALEAVGLAP